MINKSRSLIKKKENKALYDNMTYCFTKVTRYSSTICFKIFTKKTIFQGYFIKNSLNI